MCGRYSFAIEDELIHERFGVTVRSAVYKARYNCAPSQNLAVITNQNPDLLDFFRWGLIPPWANDPKIGNRMINARSETILEKPSFRFAFRNRRCLVPADGFYEWRKSDKTPFRIEMHDRRPFSMAGIWEEWKNPEGVYVRSFSILTTSPNDLMAPLHDRMPVILTPEGEQRWLTGGSDALLLAFCRPFPGKDLYAYAVTPLINSAANDHPSVLEPAGNMLF